MDSTVMNPYIPYTGPLPHPLQPGQMIRIQGTVKPSPSCFAINLQTGASTTPRSDVALHLSPVFTPPPRLVRNSLQYQQWGPEESHGSYFPFVAGQGFEIIILAESDKFKIAVNGQHFAEFSHRLPLHTISHISVDGDVTISTIRFENTSGVPSGHSGPKSDVSMPIGFVAPGSTSPGYGPSQSGGTYPVPPYPGGNPSAVPSGPYPPPPPSSPNHPYGRTSPTPYGPPAGGYPYGPPPGGNPYGPPPTSNPYGPPATSNPYGPPPGGYPGSYPSPTNPYPSQPGPYPGTTVVYPGQEKHKSSSGMDALTAGAAALAGAAGAALIGGGKHKGGKHSHYLNPASALMGGGHGGPAAMLAGGVGSLLGTGTHGPHQKSHQRSSSPIPMGGALAGGAAALAGAYMLSKSPIGKVMKPKKMKKLYKHKHKLKHGFRGFGSSSSSSSSSEEE